MLLPASPGSMVAAAAGQPAQVAPNAGSWPTWLLASGSQLRPDSAPSAAGTQTELATVQALAGEEIASNVANAVWVRAMGSSGQ